MTDKPEMHIYCVSAGVHEEDPIPLRWYIETTSKDNARFIAHHEYTSEYFDEIKEGYMPELPDWKVDKIRIIRMPHTFDHRG